MYKFCITAQSGELLYKQTFMRNYSRTRPGNASRVVDLTGYKWSDSVWMKKRQEFDVDKDAMSVYEVHPGSWKNCPSAGRDDPVL